MNKYTVIGFYRDNEQPFIQHVTAKDPKAAAVVAVCSLSLEEDYDGDLNVVEVLEGHHMGVLANEQIVEEQEFFGYDAFRWIPDEDLPLYKGLKGMGDYIERRLK